MSVLPSHAAWYQARSQDSSCGDNPGVWGRSLQPPEANGGLGANLTTARDWGSGGKTLSRRRQGGLGAEPPALGNFYDFSTKITHF